MNFTDAIKSGFNNYVGFTGRARRSEYWYWTLFVVIVSFVVGFVGGVNSDLSNIITAIVSLALFLPGLAMSVRRLHDNDRSGWFVLLALIPLVGFIILLVFYVQEGTPGDNKFGANPKA
jgi:uncharacterized membrane protein YhaH (DUF805 family)